MLAFVIIFRMKILKGICLFIPPHPDPLPQGEGIYSKLPCQEIEY
jgi:hypothetical protein